MFDRVVLLIGLQEIPFVLAKLAESNAEAEWKRRQVYKSCRDRVFCLDRAGGIAEAALISA